MKLSSEKKEYKRKGVSPTPEGPIRKRNVKVSRGGAIPEERQRERTMLGPVNNRLVHTIKHHINIRNHSRVPPEKLQQTPDREHGPALHTSIVQINEQSPSDDHRPESSEFPSLLQVTGGNSGPGPWLEILVDPPEELGAFASSRIGVGTTAFYEGIVFVGGVAASEVGAVEDLVEPRVASLAGEGLRREEVPWRRVQVVSGDGLGLGRDVVHLFDEISMRVRTEGKKMVKCWE